MAFTLTRRKIIITAIIVTLAIVALLLFSFRSAVTTWLSEGGIGGKTTGTSAKPVAGTLNDAQQEEVSQATVTAGNIYSNNSDVKGAIAAYDTYIESSNDGVVVASLLFNKGLLLLNAGEYDEALAVGMTLEASASSHSSAMLIGEAYAQLGDIDKAIQYYSLAIQRAETEIDTPPIDAAAAAQAAQKADNGDVSPSSSNNTLDGYRQRLEELQS